MRKVSKLWIAAVVGALLLGTLVGVVWARPREERLAAGRTRKVVLAAADFIPSEASEDWYNGGWFVTCGPGGHCYYTAPVVFPCLSSVTVERIKLHAYDDNVDYEATATLLRLNPARLKLANLGEISSSGSSSQYPRTFTSPNINKRVLPSQRAYILLYIPVTSTISVYGITIEYHTN
jgi:hypothetical protein